MTKPSSQQTKPSGNRAAICSLTASLGLLLIAIAACIPILAGRFPESPLYKYIYAAGALICLLSALFNPFTGTGIREKRWHRIEAWSAIFFSAAAVFLFIPGSAPRDWLAFTMAGAAIRIICFIRSTMALRKAAEKKESK